MLQLSQTSTYRAEIYRLSGPVHWHRPIAELCLASLGRFYSTGRFTFQQVMPVDRVAVHVVHRGRGVLAVGGEQFEIAEYDVFAFFPGCHYSYHDFPTTPWQYTWLDLEGPEASAAVRHFGLSERQPLLRGIRVDAEALFREICATYRRPSIAPSYAIAAGWRVIDALASARPAHTPRQGVAEMAKFLIDRSTMAAMSVDALAEQLGVSRSALFRQFRGAYGVSPKKHVDAVRLQRACQLLRESRAPLKQIAAACGYANSQYFIRAFSKAYGQAPGAWREAYAIRRDADVRKLD